LKNYEERIQDWHHLIDDLERKPLQGILPSPPDPRDYSIEDIPVTSWRLPDTMMLPKSPFILDQGQTPYCAGASGAGIANAYFNQYGLMPAQGFSMTFLYWLAKTYDGIPDRPGTYIRTILKMMQKYGCAPEILAPYSTSRININQQALREAEDYKIESYARLGNSYDIKLALNRGMYVIIGTLVTRGNWSRQHGYISHPIGELYGGHATFFWGYDDKIEAHHKGYYLGQNSWSEEWGYKGYFFLPYDYHNITLDGRPKFLEAWAVKFYDIEPRQEKEEIEDKKKDNKTRPKLFPENEKISKRRFPGKRGR